MIFTAEHYRGVGINHKDEQFYGRFNVQKIDDSSCYRFSYEAIKAFDDQCIHQESGLIGRDDSGRLTICVQMQELPCITIHRLIRHHDRIFCFSYQGQDMVNGFHSELIFEFKPDGFKYRHRWGFNEPAIDRSWCDLRSAAEN